MFFSGPSPFDWTSNKCSIQQNAITSGFICPTFACNRNLEPKDASYWKEQDERNHYRYTYKHLPLTKLTAEEHTAQLRSEEASTIQQKFIKGETNVLSCSTTFELGVDLGELEMIFLRNVPREPANYIQRAGRAGRRLDSVGFTLTFAQLRSHDLTYFKEPLKMVEGRIAPPITEIQNEKIVRRHLHSIVVARFFREHPEYFGTVESFFRLDGPAPTGLDLARKYLESRPKAILESLQRVIPAQMHTAFSLKSWDWTRELVGEGGSLELADAKIRDEHASLNEFYKNRETDYISTKEQYKRNKLNSDMSWANSRIEEIKKRSLIDYLASSTVIPKYGFPVDVVELSVLSQLPAAKKIQLERDLKIALAEFAPSSKLVAKGYLWESAGLRVVKNKTWPVQSYAVCPICQRFNIQDATISDTAPTMECSNCGTAIPRTDMRKFITPIFGFVTSRESNIQKPGESRPKREFSTRPYFYNYKEPLEKSLESNGMTIKRRYSSDGELAVVCKGLKGAGFYICFDCGRSFTGRQLKAHRKPNGEECHSALRGPFHLGHRYKTDVVSLLFKNFQASPQESESGFWYSLLYALLEGTSEALGIRRQDLDGCLYPEDNQLALVLFDNVPGGAGHVKRLMGESNFAAVLKGAYARANNCTGCGPETSCYGCLRNYQNQFCHDRLSRGGVVDFLEKNLTSLVP